MEDVVASSSIISASPSAAGAVVVGEECRRCGSAEDGRFVSIVQGWRGEAVLAVVVGVGV